MSGFLCAPVNTGIQVCTLGKWAETQPHSLSVPFLHSSFHTTQLHLLQHPSTPSTLSGPGGDTALIFSSTGHVSQNVTTLVRQGYGKVSKTSSPTLFEAPQHISADGNHWGLKRQASMPSQTSEMSCYFVPKPLIELSG